MADLALLALSLAAPSPLPLFEPKPIEFLMPAIEDFHPRFSRKNLKPSLFPSIDADFKPEFSPLWSISAASTLSNNPDRATAPRSGSQLYLQRLASLKAGKLYTRLPLDSFSEVWQQARIQPTYQQWRKLLALEAKALATGQKDREVSVLLGDSLSLWFPSDRLPQRQLWLNQGISGDTTWNILARLSAFAQIRPRQIYLMAGVNDLKQGATDAEILWNMQRIIKRLQANHASAKITVQSILPTRNSQIPNQRIAELNRKLATIARREGATYLDLFSHFVDAEGQITSDYTTDGIHLSDRGYAAWQLAVRDAETQIAQIPQI